VCQSSGNDTQARPQSSGIDTQARPLSDASARGPICKSKCFAHNFEIATIVNASLLLYDH
jgi:hypothetical protein